MLVSLPDTDRYDVTSREGHEYRIFLSLPRHEPGPDGYPVLYLLDGNATFPSAAVSLALQMRRPESTGVLPAAVVGIGYPTDDYLDAEGRTRDYTVPLAPDELPPRRDGAQWPPTGGADAFLDFIVNEVKPAIGQRFRVDRSRESLFGHSFGGFFVLHALFSRPAAFRSYIAASPSIWYGRQALDRELTAFCESRDRTVPPRRLLITVGGDEQLGEQESSGEGSASARWKRQTRMVGNARETAARIANAAGTAVDVSFTEFANENHASVLPASITRALRFALGRS